MARALPPSFFQAAAENVPEYPPLGRSRAGPTSASSAAASLDCRRRCISPPGADVVLIEAERIASGASGRNGGQIHSGLRRDVIWLEQRFGFERARILWDMAEEAKALVRGLIVRYMIACDLRSGVIETLHKASLIQDAAELVKTLSERYGLRPGNAARPTGDDRGAW